MVVAALLAVGLVGEVDRLWLGLPLAVAAVVVLAALALRAALLVCTSRERALDLIAQGRGSLALAPVERQRQRLLDPDHRERLARSLDAIRDEAERWKGTRSVRPVFSVRVVRAAAPELTRVARLVRGDHAPLAGIAMTERLVTDGCSPLYGEDLELLLQALRRTRFLLDGRDVTQ